MKRLHRTGLSLPLLLLLALALGIYHHVQLGQDRQAFQLLGCSVVLAFAALWTGERLLRNRPSPA